MDEKNKNTQQKNVELVAETKDDPDRVDNADQLEDQLESMTDQNPESSESEKAEDKEQEKVEEKPTEETLTGSLGPPPFTIIHEDHPKITYGFDTKSFKMPLPEEEEFFLRRAEEGPVDQTPNVSLTVLDGYFKEDNVGTVKLSASTADNTDELTKITIEKLTWEVDNLQDIKDLPQVSDAQYNNIDGTLTIFFDTVGYDVQNFEYDIKVTPKQTEPYDKEDSDVDLNGVKVTAYAEDITSGETNIGTFTTDIIVDAILDEKGKVIQEEPPVIEEPGGDPIDLNLQMIFGEDSPYTDTLIHDGDFWQPTDDTPWDTDYSEEITQVSIVRGEGEYSLILSSSYTGNAKLEGSGTLSNPYYIVSKDPGTPLTVSEYKVAIAALQVDPADDYSGVITGTIYWTVAEKNTPTTVPGSVVPASGIEEYTVDNVSGGDFVFMATISPAEDLLRGKIITNTNSTNQVLRFTFTDLENTDNVFTELFIFEEQGQHEKIINFNVGFPIVNTNQYRVDLQWVSGDEQTIITDLYVQEVTIVDKHPLPNMVFLASDFDVPDPPSQNKGHIMHAIIKPETSLDDFSMVYESSLVGTDNEDTLIADGTEKDHVLVGFGADDTLIGSDGNDALYGGEGGDLIDGGDGIDTATYFSSSAVHIDLTDDSFSGGEADGDDLTNIENVIGANKGEADYLRGDDEDNALLGLSGDDTLIGEGGNDTLYGGKGDDSIEGGDGDDILIGGEDEDVLDGGAGNDRFIYNDVEKDGEDIINNFDTGDDKIDLSALFDALGVPPEDREARVYKSGTTDTKIEILDSVDGDPIPDFSITVQDVDPDDLVVNNQIIVED